MEVLYSQINEIDDLLDDDETYYNAYENLLDDFGNKYHWDSIEDVELDASKDSAIQDMVDEEAYRIAKDITEDNYYNFIEPWLKNIFKTKTIVYGIGEIRNGKFTRAISEFDLIDIYGYGIADTYTDFKDCISDEYDEMEIIKQDDGLIVFGGTMGIQFGRYIAIRAMTREGAKYFNDCTTSRTHFDMDDLLDEIFTSDEYSENVEEFKY